MKLVSEVKSSNICPRSSLKRSRDILQTAISTRWIIAKVSQKLYYEFIALVSLNMLHLFVWFCRPYGGSFKSLLTRRCKTLCFTKLNSSRSPQSHPRLNGFFLTESLSSLFHFCLFLPQLPELVWKVAEKLSLQSASKRFPSLVLRLTTMKVTPKIPDFAQIET